MRRDTENFSMYSVISIRTMFFSSSKSAWASALASSVLPTPVGPRKRKEPIGLFGSCMPARERRIASETFLTASSWPITRLWSMLSRWSSFSRSLFIRRATGIPVHFATIFAISSSVTRSCSSESEDVCVFSAISSSVFSCLVSVGSLPYLSSAALLRS